MRKLSHDAGLVLLGIAFLLTFALGLYLGAKVEQGRARIVAMEAKR